MNKLIKIIKLRKKVLIIEMILMDIIATLVMDIFAIFLAKRNLIHSFL